MTILRDTDRTIYLVGTAHVSAQSAADVVHVIRSVRPDAICFELCRLRLNVLTDSCRLPPSPSKTASSSKISWINQLCTALRRVGPSGLFMFIIEQFYRY